MNVAANSGDEPVERSPVGPFVARRARPTDGRGAGSELIAPLRLSGSPSSGAEADSEAVEGDAGDGEVRIESPTESTIDDLPWLTPPEEVSRSPEGFASEDREADVAMPGVAELWAVMDPQAHAAPVQPPSEDEDTDVGRPPAGAERASTRADDDGEALGIEAEAEGVWAGGQAETGAEEVGDRAPDLAVGVANVEGEEDGFSHANGPEVPHSPEDPRPDADAEGWFDEPLPRLAEAWGEEPPRLTFEESALEVGEETDAARSASPAGSGSEAFATLADGASAADASIAVPADPAAALADRLEEIARTLRRCGPGGPFPDRTGDPLGALITGYLLGAAEARRSGGPVAEAGEHPG